MTHALPAGPQPAPRRQLLVGTGLVSAAGALLIGGMLSIWLRFREAAPLRESSDGLKQIKDWLPKDIAMAEVLTNVGLATVGDGSCRGAASGAPGGGSRVGLNATQRTSPSWRTR